MENITMAQVSHFIIGLSSLLTAGGVLVKYAMAGVKKQLEPFNKRIDEIVEVNKKSFQALQLQTDKNYLVRFLADVEKGEYVDVTEKEHFWFTYDNYHQLGGNSYIEHKVDKLKKEGKL